MATNPLYWILFTPRWPYGGDRQSTSKRNQGWRALAIQSIWIILGICIRNSNMERKSGVFVNFYAADDIAVLLYNRFYHLQNC